MSKTGSRITIQIWIKGSRTVIQYKFKEIHIHNLSEVFAISNEALQYMSDMIALHIL